MVELRNEEQPPAGGQVPRFSVPIEPEVRRAVLEFLARAGVEYDPTAMYAVKTRRTNDGRPGFQVGSGSFGVTYDLETKSVVEFSSSIHEEWSLRGYEPKGPPLIRKEDGRKAVEAMFRKLRLPASLSIPDFGYEYMGGQEKPGQGVACGAAIRDRTGQKVGAISVALWDGQLHRFWFKPWQIEREPMGSRINWPR